MRRDLYDAAVEGLAARANAIAPMDGAAEGAKMGTLSSAQQLRVVSGFVSRAVTEGAEIAAVGQPLETETDGYF